MKEEWIETIICPSCKALNSSHHANGMNSTPFCNYCGCACNRVNLTQQEISFRKSDHKAWLKKNPNKYEEDEEDRKFNDWLKQK